MIITVRIPILLSCMKRSSNPSLDYILQVNDPKHLPSVGNHQRCAPGVRNRVHSNLDLLREAAALGF